MPDHLAPGDPESRVLQSIKGGQDYLRWWHPAWGPSGQGPGGALDPVGGAPNPATGLRVGGRLIDTTALPIGTYFAAFPMNGMATVTTHLFLTFAGGATITTTIYSTYMDHQTQYNAFTGAGAVTSGAEQVATLAAPVGEQWAIVKVVVTVANATSMVWTRAEYNGQRA